MVADLASLPRHALAESVIYTRRSFGDNKARESGVEAIFFLNIVELLSPSDSRFISNVELYYSLASFEICPLR